MAGHHIAHARADGSAPEHPITLLRESLRNLNMLTHDQLFSLEQYARLRPEFRAKVIAHKKNRQVPSAPTPRSTSRTALTMQYQVQEMLRLERMFEPEAIQDELDVYNPLIPDGSNWKATFMVEFSDEAERKSAACETDRHREGRLGAGRRLRPQSRRSPTRISTARPRKRLRPCISCASS